MNGIQIPLSLQLSRLSVAFHFNPSPFTMPSAILTAYIVCFSMGLIPSIKLLYRDAKPHNIVEINGTFRAATFKERLVVVVFDIVQIGLLVNDIAAVTMEIVPTSQFKWIDPSITCTVQIFTGMNVRTAAHIRWIANHSFDSLPATSAAFSWTALSHIYHIQR